MLTWLVPFSAIGAPTPACRVVANVPGCAVPRLRVGRDQRRALLQIVLVEQRRDAVARQRHEVGVGHVQVAVRISEALRFADQMHALHGRLAAFQIDRGRGERRKAEVLQNAQNLRDRDAARRWRRHAANGVDRAVTAADGVAPLRLVVGQIGQRRQARRDRAAVVGAAGDADLVDDRLREHAGVQRIRAVLGDQLQRIRIVRVFDRGAQRLRAAVRVQEVGGGLRVAPEVVGRTGDCFRHAPADAKAVVGEPDGRVEQRRPTLVAVVLLHQLQHAHRTRRADRAAAGARVGQHRAGCGAVAHVAQIVFGGGGRRGFTPVVRLHLPCLRVVVHQESPAADARGLGLDQAQHHLHRHGRIGCAAAVLQHIAACFGGERVRRHHHVTARGDDLLAGAIARRRLRQRGIAGVARADDDAAAVGREFARVARDGIVVAVVAVTARGDAEHRRCEQRHDGWGTGLGRHVGTLQKFKGRRQMEHE